MQKIIWTCWFQGRDEAPDLVKRCLTSWERENPDWEVRCLDSRTVGRYLDIREYVDLDCQAITAASLSDIIRIFLLHEYGGAWVDATLYCNRPLDDWLPGAMGTGFFAFDAPAADRMLASWFLACEPGNGIVAKWATRCAEYWRNRDQSEDYFWFHHQFSELLEVDPEARAEWEVVPLISADGAHFFQTYDAMYQPASEWAHKINWTTPVFKLTHRISSELYRPGCLLHQFLNRFDFNEGSTSAKSLRREHSAMPFAATKVSTENLGDHIQILAANRLLARLGIEPQLCVDRDNEIATSAKLTEFGCPVGILVNGWFKTNPREWPPHPNLVPLYLGFHIRLFQSSTLISDAAIENYRKHGPIGCRDDYTLSLLQRHGVDAFLSNCLSLILPRRLEYPERQDQVFVVSRDDQILDRIPEDLGPIRFVSHYSGSTDFEENMRKAADLLTLYRTRARLVITTLLHCALPAIAMGIPVIVFYPQGTGGGDQSDRERFSTLERMIRVFHFDETHKIDWRGRVVEASQYKLALIDAFHSMIKRWQLPPEPVVGPIAPSAALPVSTY